MHVLSILVDFKNLIALQSNKVVNLAKCNFPLFLANLYRKMVIFNFFKLYTLTML
jgi:hypothetical protein